MTKNMVILGVAGAILGSLYAGRKILRKRGRPPPPPRIFPQWPAVDPEVRNALMRLVDYRRLDKVVFARLGCLCNDMGRLMATPAPPARLAQAICTEATDRIRQFENVARRHKTAADAEEVKKILGEIQSWLDGSLKNAILIEGVNGTAEKPRDATNRTKKDVSCLL